MLLAHRFAIGCAHLPDFWPMHPGSSHVASQMYILEYSLKNQRGERSRHGRKACQDATEQLPGPAGFHQGPAPSTFLSRSVRGRFLNADSIVLATDFMTISNAACPCSLLRAAIDLASDPTGKSFSQKGINGSSAARTKRSVSGMDRNTTSCPRAFSLRASVVIGLRCPGTRTPRNAIFICPPDRIMSGDSWWAVEINVRCGDVTHRWAAQRCLIRMVRLR